MLQDGWCLVLALWGQRYHAGHVNQLVRSALDASPDCRRVVLVTDEVRSGIDDRVVQSLFPPEFRRPEFFHRGFMAKLAVFASPDLPERTRCVYVDLDTIVTGDLGRIARLIETPNDYCMLPAGTVGFNGVTRWLHRVTGGRVFSTGNSSVHAFSSAAEPNLARRFLELHDRPETQGQKHMKLDDRFISWFAQPNLRPVPTNLAVMFRREFLSRSLIWTRLKARIPRIRRRREGLVAVTLNRIPLKMEALATMPSGVVIRDTKGRKGYWSDAAVGPLRHVMIAQSQWIVGYSPPDHNRA